MNKENGMPEESTEELTPEDLAYLEETFGIPKGEEKAGVYQFFNEVRKTSDTSKVANLDDNEKEAVYIDQHTALYADKMCVGGVGEYNRSDAEIILRISDSKKGFLLKTVGTQRREIKSKSEDGEKKKKGWFGKERGEEE
jgi:hypothetical protein